MKKRNNLLKNLHEKGLLDDNGADRGGWARQPSWDKEIKPKLKLFLELSKDKIDFIFIGMGGSINTVKAVGKMLGNNSENKIFTLDSLDPAAIDELRPQIDPSKTLFVVISKSGKTKETTQLAKTVKNIFTADNLNPSEHFILMTDPQNEGEIDKNEWQNTTVIPIQVDDQADIGGRFTAPHTLISLLPLLVLNNKDVDAVKKLWNEYILCSNKQVEQTLRMAKELSSSVPYFAVCLPGNIGPALETWITQLFQESLGSKKEGYNPKTIVVSNLNEVPKGFVPISWDIETEVEMVRAMSIMYLSQVLVAQLALDQGVNFVDQPAVESYKTEMRNMAEGEALVPKIVNQKELLDEIENELNNKEYRFIEAVSYWHLSDEERLAIKNSLEDKFGNKIVLVFTGSDWNHHSYQAASQNKDTLFLILTKPNYLDSIKNVDSKKLKENIEDLKIIAGATYKTIADKALFLALE